MGLMKQETVTKADTTLGKNAGSATLNLKHKLYKPKPGLALLDIIPFKCTTDRNRAAAKDDYAYVAEYWLHAIGSSYATVRCSCLRGIGQTCPICEEVSRLYSLGGNEDLPKSLRAKARNLYQVIDRSNTQAGIQILDISYAAFGEVLIKAKNKYGDYRYNSFMELEGGLTLEVDWTEKPFGKGKFVSAASITFAKRDYDYPMGILEQTEDLDAAVQYLTPVAVKELLHGGSEEDQDDSPLRSEAETVSVNTIPTTQVRTTQPTAVQTDHVQTRPAQAQPATRVEQVGFATPPVSVKVEETPSCPAGRKFGDFDRRDADCQGCLNYKPCREKKLESV